MISSASRIITIIEFIVVFCVVGGSAYDIVWNAPSAGCQGCANASDHVTPEKYGLVVNEGQAFLGSRVSCLYRVGLWPFLAGAWPNATYTNGGIPQLGDLSRHLAQVRVDIDSQIPDESASGYFIIDWEAWRVLYVLNWDSLSPYQKASDKLVRDAHPSWSQTQVKAEAERQFNEAAQSFFLQTLRLAQRMRPRAHWGYYEYPMIGALASNPTPDMTNWHTWNDQLQWLWNEIGLLSPSFYLRDESPVQTPAANQTQWVVSGIHELYRVANNTVRLTRDHHRPLIVPYSGLFYRSGPPYGGLTLQSESDLAAAVLVPASMGADAVVLWGSSSDTNSCDKCGALEQYLTRESAGTVMQACITNRKQCRAAHCSGHGNCIDMVALDWSSACQSTASPRACLCDSLWSGSACQHQLSPQL